MERLTDRYDVAEEIGGTGRARVLRGWDRRRARAVAIKIVPVPDEDQRERLRGQVELLMGVPAHPGLVAVVDEVSVDRSHAVVLDWVEGVDLGSELRENGRPGLDLEMVLACAEQVASALDHLHRGPRPVVHGDIKPSNIVRTPEGRVVVVDFGSSVVPGEPATTGTRGYAAPELASSGLLTPASDVYGLAATVVALLTGRPPDGGRPRIDDLPPDTAARLRHTLARALATDPHARPASAGDLARALRGRDAGNRCAMLVAADLDESETAPDPAEGARRSRAIPDRHLGLLMAEVAEDLGGVALHGRGRPSPRVYRLPGPDAAIAFVSAIRHEYPRRVPSSVAVRLRMALHAATRPAADAEVAVIGALRLSSPGLTVVTGPAARAVSPPAGLELVRIGVFSSELSRPVQLFALADEGADPPPLRAKQTESSDFAAEDASSGHPFIGRSAELESLLGLVTSERLVTVTGAAGIGKSRTSEELVRAVAGGFPDGVWWVDLHAAAAVAPAVLAALGAEGSASGTLATPTRPRRRSAEQRLLERLVGQSALLVLDGCDELLEESAELLNRLLADCPSMTILATSRTPLGMVEERVLRLGPLEDADALRLLSLLLHLDRPAASEQDLDVARDICQLVDRVPQSLVVAASRWPAMSLAQIRDSLTAGHPGSSGGRDAHAALQWSVASLPPDELELLAAVTLFPSGFSAEAASAVGGVDRVVALSLLYALTRRSLLEAERSPGPARFRMLTATREVAAAHLTSSGRLRSAQDRFAAWGEDFVARFATGCAGRDQAHWLDAAHVDIANLRAAFECGLARPGTSRPARLAAGLATYWMVRGPVTQGREWLRRALAAMPGGEADVEEGRREAECTAGWLACFGGDPVAAATASLRAIGSSSGAGASINARALSVLGLVASSSGQQEVAIRRHEAALASARSAGDRAAVAFVTANLANPLALRGRVGEARKLLEDSLALRRAQEDSYGISWSCFRLGLLLLSCGEMPEARGLLLEAWESASEIGYTQGRINAALGLGRLLLSTGHPRAGARWFAEADEAAESVGDPTSRSLALAGTLECAAWGGSAADLARCMDHLDASDWAGSVETVADRALAHAAVAEIAAETGEARDRLRQALVALAWLGDRGRQVEVLERLAVLAAAEDQWRDAAFLFTLARRERERTGWIPRRGPALAAVAAHLRRDTDP
ncbi:MAG TPA: protein kinase, partial [Actinomycetes bacterium]|nr:protein kinase [Actinomycetes bacterium]